MVFGVLYQDLLNNLGLFFAGVHLLVSIHKNDNAKISKIVFTKN